MSLFIFFGFYGSMNNDNQKAVFNFARIKQRVTFWVMEVEFQLKPQDSYLTMWSYTSILPIAF